ncbi:MAG: hypothetical protein M1436_05055 [Acidobacteria bacterium]|nr:hypothetical protein [Acidobacteriota bacterium]
MTTRVSEGAALERTSGTPAAEIAMIAAAIVLLTLCGFFWFPGHTYLQSDTQIYIPILEHLWDHSVLQNDLLAREPHVSFTIYDETALFLRRITGLGFREVLVFQQLLFRALGLLGVFLLAAALGVSKRAALLVTGIFSLGAMVSGPMVLLVEYEPVPRGFAIPLVFLALGLAAHGRDVWAGVAASLAFLYHPPSLLPFWAVYFCLTLWPSRPADMRRRILGLVPILCGVLVLFVLSRLQPGSGQPQGFFSRLDPEVENLQRIRANYDFVSIWGPLWAWHYVFLWLAGFVAFLRIRKSASLDLKFFLTGLPLIGILSVPVSYLLLEKMRWALIPQVQPARTLLFVTALAIFLAAIAAIKAAEHGRYWESLLWFVPAFAIPVQPRVLDILLPQSLDPVLLRRVALVWAFAASATLALWAAGRKQRLAASAFLVGVLFLPFFLIPTWGKVVNYPQVENSDLDALSAWARSSTPKDAVFAFPDAGRDLYPGIFRANSLRAVYADWKAGGQINFLKIFARVWWPRWQEMGAGKFKMKNPDAYGKLGIDYIVLRQANRVPGRIPAFENARYAVYATRAVASGPPL